MTPEVAAPEVDFRTTFVLPQCPHCQQEIDLEFLSSQCGRLSAARGKGSAGRHKKLRTCRFGCGAKLGVREMRAHIVACPVRVRKPSGRPKKKEKVIKPKRKASVTAEAITSL